MLAPAMSASSQTRGRERETRGALPGCDQASSRAFLPWKRLPKLQRPPKFLIVPAKRGQSGRGVRCQAICIVGTQSCLQNQVLSHQAREGNLLARDAAG